VKHREAAIAMKILGSKRVWVSLGILLVCTVGVVLWRERWWTAYALKQARDGLQWNVDALSRRDEEFSLDVQELRLLQMHDLMDAITRLDAAPPSLPQPVPVVAIAHEGGDRDMRLNLGLQWVENGYGVIGFYVMDHDGGITEFPVFANTELIKDLYFRAGLRHVFVGILTNASDEEWWQRDGPYPWLVRLPPGYFSKGNVRLGLLTKSGRQPITIPVRYWAREDKENQKDGDESESESGAKRSQKDRHLVCKAIFFGRGAD
jgi:hypothetical protein